MKGQKRFKKKCKTQTHLTNQSHYHQHGDGTIKRHNHIWLNKHQNHSHMYLYNLKHWMCSKYSWFEILIIFTKSFKFCREKSQGLVNILGCHEKTYLVFLTIFWTNHSWKVHTKHSQCLPNVITHLCSLSSRTCLPWYCCIFKEIDLVKIYSILIPFHTITSEPISFQKTSTTQGGFFFPYFLI
jgi:hypothetical protein